MHADNEQSFRCALGYYVPLSATTTYIGCYAPSSSVITTVTATQAAGPNTVVTDAAFRPVAAHGLPASSSTSPVSLQTGSTGSAAPVLAPVQTAAQPASYPMMIIQGPPLFPNIMSSSVWAAAPASTTATSIQTPTVSPEVTVTSVGDPAGDTTLELAAGFHCLAPSADVDVQLALCCERNGFLPTEHPATLKYYFDLGVKAFSCAQPCPAMPNMVHCKDACCATVNPNSQPSSFVTETPSLPSGYVQVPHEVPPRPRTLSDHACPIMQSSRTEPHFRQHSPPCQGYAPQPMQRRTSRANLMSFNTK